MTKEKTYGQNSVATSAVATICKEYGFPFYEEDLEFDEFEDMWYFTPYEGEAGFRCKYGFWWGVNLDSYTIRLMECDFDMFDKIAKALDGVETISE